MSRAGTTNKNKQFLLKRLQAMYGDDFHPIMEIAKNCVVLQKQADNLEDPDQRYSALKSANAEWSRMAEYTEPKLRAIEVDASIDLGLIELSDDALERRLFQLEQELKRSEST